MDFEDGKMWGKVTKNGLDNKRIGKGGREGGLVLLLFFFAIFPGISWASWVPGNRVRLALARTPHYNRHHHNHHTLHTTVSSTAIPG